MVKGNVIEGHMVKGNMKENNKAGSGMARCNLWLTLRFLRKQKLRSAAISCGIMFSVFLLTAFVSMGYDFWRQVHGGTGGHDRYDSTRKILLLLVIALLALIASCTAILLRNLFSLTFMQRWRSLVRLISLGADFRDMIAMEVMGTGFLFCIAAPTGYMLASLTENWIDIRQRAPLWMIGVAVVGIFLVSCICSVMPLRAAYSNQEQRRLSLKVNRLQRKQNKRQGKESIRRRKQSRRQRERIQTIRRVSSGFQWYMANKYRQANRGHYVRVAVTIIAAILLYVPAGYLIDTNISVQRAGLYAKYGIQYACSPQDKEELTAAFRECGQLAECGMDCGAIFYVSMYTEASVKIDAISSELRSVLKDAGWDGRGENENGRSGGKESSGGESRSDETDRIENQLLAMDANIVFVDHSTYMEYLRTARDTEVVQSTPAILFNRYTNRTSWSEKSDIFYQETSLLDNEADGSAVRVYYDLTGEFEPDRTKYLVPDLIINQMPEGIDFTGDLFLILPLECMEDFDFSNRMYERLQVYGKFEDNDEDVFCRLEIWLGDNPVGQLTYTRKILQEWYDSMEGIHLAMNAICLILFFAAVLNVFSMMIFQYMERKKGLAVLWSVGQSTGGLLQILIVENIYHFLIAIIAGIPLSAFLCYCIYRIFRKVWQVGFALPIRQITLIFVSALIVSAVALLLDGILMRRQNFLSDIKSD